MVVPANHAGMGGSLTVTNDSTALTIVTGAADGIRIVLQKNPLRLEFYHRGTGALLAKEDATRSITWGGTNNSVITEAFVPPPADEHFVKAGHGLYGRSPRVDRTGDVVSHNYGTVRSDQAPAIVPLYLSTKGYGVFFNTTFDTTFSFASGTARDYAFSADDHGTAGARPQMDYFLINGPQFAKLLDRYTQLTGRPRLPQLAIFGLHMSDKGFPDVSDQNWWRTKITQHRNAGFPFDHHVNDNRWRSGTGAWGGSWFEFSSVRWPDPAAYQAWAADNGVTMTLDYNRNNSNLMAGWVGRAAARLQLQGRRPHRCRGQRLGARLDQPRHPRLGVERLLVQGPQPGAALPRRRAVARRGRRAGPHPVQRRQRRRQEVVGAAQRVLLLPAQGRRRGGLGPADGRAHRRRQAPVDLEPRRVGRAAALRSLLDRRHRLHLRRDAAADQGHAGRRAAAASRIPTSTAEASTAAPAA